MGALRRVAALGTGSQFGLIERIIVQILGVVFFGPNAMVCCFAAVDY